MSNDNLESARRQVKLLNAMIADGVEVLIGVECGKPTLRPSAFFVGMPDKDAWKSGPLHFPVFAVVGDGINTVRPEPFCIDGFSLEVILISPQIQDAQFEVEKK